MKKVGVVSLGCCKNLVDSQMLLGYFCHAGYQVVVDPKKADVIIVNTCGFILDSKKESIDTIFEMSSYNKKLIVTGCLAQRYYKELKEELVEANQIIKIDDYDNILDKIKEVDSDFNNTNRGLSYFDRVLDDNAFSTYLKIGEGCSNNCTYCAIPLIRGPLKSRPMESIVKEAQMLANKKIKELVVIAQDTTKYGLDIYHEIKIEDLLKNLLKIKEFSYIRLLYLYPDEISDELIHMFKNEKRLTPYFDIPIQHSEDNILKAMNRRGNKLFLKTLFNKIKKEVPNAILRTTIMVGFPNESEEDFNNLCEFIKEIRFDHLGVFTYSREEDTLSYDMPNQIDEETKQKRKDILLKIQRHISYQNNQKHLNEIMEGIVVAKNKNYYMLRSYFNAPDDIDGNIYFTSNKPIEIGTMAKIKITQALVYDLYGELIELN